MFFSDLLRRVVAVLLAVGVVGVTSYAYLGSITGIETAGRAGAGMQSVSGYAINDVEYMLNAKNAKRIDAVAFTLDGPATMARVRLAARDPWYPCAVDAAATASVRGVTGRESWTAMRCDTTSPQATVAKQDQFSVVAHS